MHLLFFFFCAHVHGKSENKMKQIEEEWRRNEGHTVNVEYLARAALYLQVGKIQSFVCAHNRLAFQSSDVCTQSS